MKLHNKINAKNILLILLSVWILDGVLSAIKEESIHVKAVTFTLLDDPIMFWFFVLFSSMGCLAILLIVVFSKEEPNDRGKTKSSSEN